MKNIHLRVLLPKNRNLTGSLVFEVDGRSFKRYKVLGRGSRGSGDTSLLINGNTPLGEYHGNYLVDTSKWNKKSYGADTSIRLKPVGGDAIKAKSNGRKGLLIHGGALGGAKYWRGKGALRATFGCLRLTNQDIKDLVSRIIEIRYSDTQKMCVNTYVKVTVKEN